MFGSHSPGLDRAGAGLHPRLVEWFAEREWSPFAYQSEAWAAYAAGESGLIHAPTGTGKTLAAWLGPVMEWLDEAASGPAVTKAKKTARASSVPLRVLWITPMRALASDTLASLMEPVEMLGLPWSIEKRTGDTAASLRLKQKERLPTALVTTPESLTVLLSQPGARERFATLRAVVVDEWHELLSSKRGVQTELALARLRAFKPGLRTWGISATLGNLREAMDTLCPPGATDSPPRLVHAEMPKALDLHTIIPPDFERFPWAGHMGLNLVEAVAETIERAGSTLVFSNTRSQAELWFKALLDLRPEWLGKIALHHGSLDRALRAKVEAAIKSGALKCVVCTSSLDLGVDFSPVEQVVQVGSPKGVARLMQRAGRSGHSPGEASRVVCVPAHAFELVEFAAARGALEDRDIEPRAPLVAPLDVLAQHLVTVASSEPFEEGALLAEVRSTRAYSGLTTTQWGWVLDFVTRGGAALRAYPQFARVSQGEDGLFRVASEKTAREHRMAIGTISSDNSLMVRVQNGGVLGAIEESFVSRLAVGDKFLFAGRVLQLVRIREMTVIARKATGARGVVPRWSGGQMSLSSRLAGRVRAMVAGAAASAGGGTAFHSPEMIGARPLLDLQARWSRLPREDELLIESTKTREGYHVFLYPFEGRSVHEGLGAILARRLARLEPRSVLVAMNDYGLELSSTSPIELDEAGWRSLLSSDGLLADMLASVNTSEMTRRRFRDIARVAGLISPGFPGATGKMVKKARHVQASADLFFDVFTEFDPVNLLLDQAKREVLEEQLEIGRLRRALERFASMTLVRVDCPRLTPLAFPIWAESLRTQQVSSERWSDRVKRMVLQLEEEASAPAAVAAKSKPRRVRV